ncbi:hypothetical protein [Kitasatospora paranensis]|uniref:C2H2-type domain-containing protein n=1 Tax=Kitasatospora paranensis TaxID=258053 RepID=A0ABW2FZI2_9ACTN
MTDRSNLGPAPGPADDVPALLDGIEADPDDASWNRLWEALYPQGGTRPASFAALPRLAALAATGDPDSRVNALFLAGAVLGGQDRDSEVRTTHAAAVATLLHTAQELRPALAAAKDPAEYVYLLESVLAFEGVPVWSTELGRGLANGGYELYCPHCSAGQFIAIGPYGHFSTSGDWTPAADATTLPLRPADPADLHGIGRRLHRTALADGREDVATALTHLFGTARCTGCRAEFSVADQAAVHA